MTTCTARRKRAVTAILKRIAGAAYCDAVGLNQAAIALRDRKGIREVNMGRI